MAGTFGDHLSQLPLHRRGNCAQARSKSCPGFILWQMPFLLLNLSQLRVCVISFFSHVWLFVTLRTVAHQAPLSMGFSRQEYESGLPCPTPADLPNPGVEPRSSALQADSLLLSHQARLLSQLPQCKYYPIFMHFPCFLIFLIPPLTSKINFLSLQKWNKVFQKQFFKDSFFSF